ncbi:hypothetical protein ACFQVC_08535 [Streptomyces monticola]|uniref:ANTAR domain-containing protein n=1 Tax=Streptomyces monticola TaxID=2666263 RepID=A0ABW2JE17_9ACTN
MPSLSGMFGARVEGMTVYEGRPQADVTERLAQLAELRAVAERSRGRAAADEAAVLAAGVRLLWEQMLQPLAARALIRDVAVHCGVSADRLRAALHDRPGYPARRSEQMARDQARGDVDAHRAEQTDPLPAPRRAPRPVPSPAPRPVPGPVVGGS